ncbi:porin [Noviherbaspirillum sp. UKPF54]|uniref:porin n=1 Tax=Noviherbaspirillum sp. UKPF54 TaxID=2601898 RepID=UPI00143D10E8|nr:porin [Noviherbaspirillum sp. UKPF54]
MKKSLVSLAVLAAFAGAASAQTNITVYGVADAAISYKDNGKATDSKTWAVDSGQLSGSRLGFKGSEDLGGGLSAIFTLENGFTIDDGQQAQGRLFGRQAFVGLQGGFGAVKLGRQYNPIRVAVEGIDPFRLAMGSWAKNVFSLYDERADNTINYTSANFGGFTGQLAYSFGENATGTSIGRQLGLSGTYANGPLTAVLAYHNQNLTAGTAPAQTDAGSAKTTLLGGTYNFGPATLHAGYAWDKGNPATGADNLDNRDWMLGASAPVGGAGTVLASYMKRDDRLATNQDVKQWALGYTHALSKRTTLYTLFNHIDRENVTPSTTKQFSVGMRHTF